MGDTRLTRNSRSTIPEDPPDDDDVDEEEGEDEGENEGPGRPVLDISKLQPIPPLVKGGIADANNTCALTVQTPFSVKQKD